MANVIYPLFKQYLLDMAMGAGSSPATPVVKAILIDLGNYTYSASHQFLSDVASGARTAISPAITSKTFTGGVFDGADPTWTAVTGNQSEAVIFFIDTGTASTSRLILFDDTSIVNSPVTPNGGDINLVFDAAGVFAL